MLKAIIASLEDAPEAVRSFYTAGKAEDGTDGKFVLTVEAVDGFALENVTGLKSTLSKEMGQRKALEKSVKAFEGLDPDKARVALEKYEEFSTLDPAKEADKIANSKFEAAKAQLLESHKRDLAAREESNATLSKLVDNYARRQEAIAEIAAAKGSVDLLLPHVLNATKTEIVDGQVKVRVLQPDGNDKVNAKGDPASIRDMIAEMKASETFARAFEGDGQTGTGKTPDHGGGKPAKGSFGGSKEERVAAIKSNFGL